jgi:hypothetical protein
LWKAVQEETPPAVKPQDEAQEKSSTKSDPNKHDSLYNVTENELIVHELLLFGIIDDHKSPFSWFHRLFA